MWRVFRAWLRRRPIIHSMVLAAILSLLTGTVATVQHVATGDVGIDKNLCVEGQGHPEFGSVSWYKEGYDCPLQCGSILNAIVIYSAAYSPLYFIWMAFYIAHRFAVARQAQRDAQQTRADARSGGQSEAGILQTWEAFGAWLRRRPIIHSAALTVVLSTLTAVPLTAYLTAGGGVGNPPDLCRPHKGYTGFGDISWGDGVYCTPQWDTIIWVHLLFTMMVSLPFVLWMFAYTTYRYSVEIPILGRAAGSGTGAGRHMLWRERRGRDSPNVGSVPGVASQAADFSQHGSDGNPVAPDRNSGDGHHGAGGCGGFRAPSLRQKSS